MPKNSEKPMAISPPAALSFEQQMALLENSFSFPTEAEDVGDGTGEEGQRWEKGRRERE